jgi:hypothetical protein
MKKIEDIEKILREEKLPDQDTSAFKLKIWQQILQERRQRKNVPLLMKIKPWMWFAASMLLLIICLLMMWMMTTKILTL